MPFPRTITEAIFETLEASTRAAHTAVKQAKQYVDVWEKSGLDLVLDGVSGYFDISSCNMSHVELYVDASTRETLARLLSRVRKNTDWRRRRRSTESWGVQYWFTATMGDESFSLCLNVFITGKQCKMVPTQWDSDPTPVSWKVVCDDETPE